MLESDVRLSAAQRSGTMLVRTPHHGATKAITLVCWRGISEGGRERVGSGTHVLLESLPETLRVQVLHERIRREQTSGHGRRRDR